jgi:hypothetical protein
MSAGFLKNPMLISRDDPMAGEKMDWLITFSWVRKERAGTVAYNTTVERSNLEAESPLFGMSVYTA